MRYLFLVLAFLLNAVPAPAHALTGADRLFMVMADVVTIPDAPTIGTLTAGNGQVTITFTPPVNNGGATITSYTATTSPNGYTATGSGSPLTISVPNNIDYTVQVTAHNAAGDSVASAWSNHVTPTVVVASSIIKISDSARGDRPRAAADWASTETKSRGR